MSCLLFLSAVVRDIIMSDNMLPAQYRDNCHVGELVVAGPVTGAASGQRSSYF